MILHQYPDGSEGREYEVGDSVKITDAIGGVWFQSVVGRCGVVTKIEPYDRSRPDRYTTAMLSVRYSPDWGPSTHFPWMVEPTPDTRVSGIVPATT